MQSSILWVGVLGILSALLAALVVVPLLDQRQPTAAPAKVDGGVPTVVVVGGGLAGMTAALEAERNGAIVVLLEKERNTGGNSAKASSGINGVHTKAQLEAGSPDTYDAFLADTLESGHGLCNTELAKQLVNSSTEAIDYLSGFDVDLTSLSQCGGHKFARTHRSQGGASKNVGWEIVSKLQQFIRAKSEGRITVVTQAKLTRLVQEYTSEKVSRIVGVEYLDLSKNPPERMELLSDVVILTTGGFGRNKELLSKYTPAIKELPSTNGPWAQGEGVLIAEEIGASLVHMDQVQVHPTAFVDVRDPKNPTKFLAPEALRAVGGILVNAKGKRFVNELGLRDHVTNAIFEHCSPLDSSSGSPVVGYLLMNERSVRKFSESAIAFYKSKGFVRTFADEKAAAEAFKIDANALRETLVAYEAAATAGIDEFGKTVFPTTLSPGRVVSVMPITPAIHYTMGGLLMDGEARVLRNDRNPNADPQPIPGLYAAGEVTGGVHGANRLAGNSLLECVVFGRLAGRNAVAYVKQLPAEVRLKPSSHNPPPPPEFADALESIFKTYAHSLRAKTWVSTTPLDLLTHASGGGYGTPALPDFVVYPENVAQVMALLRFCHPRHIPVVPFGSGSSIDAYPSNPRGGISLDLRRNFFNMTFVSLNDFHLTVPASMKLSEVRNWLSLNAADSKLQVALDTGFDTTIGGLVSAPSSPWFSRGYGEPALYHVDVLEGVYMNVRGSAVRDVMEAEGTRGIVLKVTLLLRPNPDRVAVRCIFPSDTAALQALVGPESVTRGPTIELEERMDADAEQMIRQVEILGSVTTRKLDLHHEVGSNATAYAALVEYYPMWGLESEGREIAAARIQDVAEKLGADDCTILYAKEGADFNERQWPSRSAINTAALALGKNARLLAFEADYYPVFEEKGLDGAPISLVEKHLASYDLAAFVVAIHTDVSVLSVSRLQPFTVRAMIAIDSPDAFQKARRAVSEFPGGDRWRLQHRYWYPPPPPQASSTTQTSA